MKIISVDNEKIAVEYMESLIAIVEPDAEFNGFTKVEQALEFLNENKVDVALLDIEMGNISGITLALCNTFQHVALEYRHLAILRCL